MRWTSLRVPALALLALLLASCGGGSSTSTPSSTPNDAVVLESQQLVPVGDRFCHVQGTARNLADEDVTVTLRWQAFDAAGKSIATTATVVVVAGGSTVSYDATGFFDQNNGLVPCSQIVRFQRIFDAV